MLDSQNLIFDLLWSHLQDGRVVQSRHYPAELVIKGVSYGRPNESTNFTFQQLKVLLSQRDDNGAMLERFN